MMFIFQVIMGDKICLLADSLSNGGAEKMVSNLSFSLCKKGYEVHIVSMRNEISYEFAGQLYNFGIVKERENKLNAFLELKKYFKKQNFDVIIDHRMRNKLIKEILFAKYIFKKFKVIYCVHHYKLSYYFSKHKNSSLLNFQHVKKRKFVAVSLEIKEELKKQLNIDGILIYNYTLSTRDKRLEFQDPNSSSDYVIAVGRLQKIKQFDILITCYSNSELPQNNIKLLIFGNGEEKANLIDLIRNLELEKRVLLMGFREDVLSFVEKAKALVMTSKSEGFPMVLIEALALRTPLVSFNCKSGPDEIIKHGINGLLVKDQDVNDFTRNLNKLLNHNTYSNLLEGVSFSNNQFTEEYIFKKWIQLLDSFK